MDTPILLPPLTNEQTNAILGRLEAAWESLFYPPPPDCAREIHHDYLSSEKRQSILELIERLRIGAQEVRDLVAEKESKEKELRDLQKRYERIEGIDRDGTLAKINAELASVNTIIEQQEHERGDLGRQVKALDGTIDQERANYARMHEQIVKSSPAKSNIAKAQRVYDLVEELIPQLYTLKTKQLGEAMTTTYRKLAHQNQIDRIEIDENGASRLLARDGTEIHFDRSAGENQLFATTLLAGLAEVSGIVAPLVVDTPLARLDSQHRRNILNFWISNKSRQVILLSQDKEIDEQMFENFRGAVSKSYLLEHQDLGRGVGRTTAVENAYFGRDA